MADKAPTEAEIKAAQAVLGRAAEAQQKEADAKLQPLRDITASPEFGAVRDAVEALPPEFMGDMAIAPHIMALRAGFNGLAAIAPPTVADAPANPAVAAGGGTTGGANA